MELNKKNFNKILNNFIAGVCLVLVSILIALCFITPYSKANALTEADIAEYNIHFVAAKTKVRSANGINKKQLKGYYDGEYYTYSDYQYSYETSEDRLYYSKLQPSSLDTQLGSVSLASQADPDSTVITKEITYVPYNPSYSRPSGFIPNGIEYFDNIDGHKEKIFYDKINNNDYVLLDNFDYSYLNTSDKFNVENFYLSFGTTYIDDQSTTPIYSLRVSAKLYSEGKVHLLNTNETSSIDIGDGKTARYWNQYFDLKNLSARTTNEESSPSYSVENPQGKYEVEFYFIRYDEQLKPVSESEEVFKFSFYLLDSADYSNYPTLHNANVTNKSEFGTVVEQFYNFNNDAPYVEYDPTKYNIAYNRTNNKSVNNVSESITSSYVQGTYTIDDHTTYPKGIISYYNRTTLKKQVFVLTHYNSDQSLVEHVYLSRTNPSANNTLIPDKYDRFMTSLENNSLEFEYKISKVLNTTYDNSNPPKALSYTISTYLTTDYAKIKDGLFVDSASELSPEDKLPEEDTIITCNYDTNSTDISFVTNTTTSDISFSKYTESGDLVGLNSSDTLTYLQNDNWASYYGKNPGNYAVIINNNTLLREPANKELDNNSTKYYISAIKTDTNGKITDYELSIDVIDPSTNSPTTYSLDLPIDTVIPGRAYSVSFDVIPHITIEYIVEEIVESEKKTTRQISSIVLSLQDSIAVSSNATNQKQLYNVLNYDDNYSLDLNFTYRYVVDELGIYDFTYSYVSCANNAYYVNSTSTAEASNNITAPAKYYSNSTNRTAPINYSYKIINTTETNATERDYNLYVGVSGEVKNTQVTLLNKTYAYDPSNPTLIKEGDNEYTVNFLYEQNFAQSKPAFFNIEKNGTTNILVAYFKIGDFTEKNSTVSTTTYTQLGNINLRNVIKTQTTREYTFDDLSGLAGEHYVLFNSLVDTLKGTLNTESNSLISTETTSTSVIEGQERLHIFGSISYFNKADAYSDSNYTKLEQVDSKLNVDYVSDVTSLYREKYYGSTAYGVNGFVNEDDVDASKFKGNIASLLKENNIIVTDVAPILWNNYSTLYYTGSGYSSNKVSTSYIYRYKYHFDTEGNIVIDNNSCITSTYTKDVYCQFDGLYEIVVFYKYDNLPETDKQNIYYQLFTFIIDNSSPTISVEVEKLDELGQPILDGDNVLYEEFDLNKFTNRNVRISWKVPNFFQNDVYLEIDKKYFDNTNTSNNFNAIYKQLETKIKSGNSTYVKGVSEMGTLTKIENDKPINYYYVDLKITDKQITTMDGNYKIIVHYSTNGNSTFTEEFTIDKQNIDNMHIKPVMKCNDGSYQVNDTLDFGNSQIINTDFTFRFNEKASGADIFVYYDKINLTGTYDYDEIINLNNSDLFGITTKYEVNGKKDNISVGTPYVYEYTHQEDPNKVNSKNLLTSSSSCLYLFRLTDEAGNEARFVVFYDDTDPRFIITPEPDSETRIVNDTTRLIWGDYKAIKVDTELTDIDLSSENGKVDNYKKVIANESNPTTDLVLRYLNTSNAFNNSKVQKVGDDYYIFVPNTSATFTDSQYSPNKVNTIKTETGGNREYFLFPINPVTSVTHAGEENYTLPHSFNSASNNDQFKITLPIYDNNGNVQFDANNKVKTGDYRVISYTITQERDSYNSLQSRYITITYELSAGSNNTISGAIGEGIFTFDISDKNINKTSTMVWMNLDKTETLAYGVFNYSDSLNDKELVALPTDQAGQTYSVSKLYISSLNTNEENSDVPDYEVTYKHYAYDASLYANNTITNVSLESNGNGTYLRISMIDSDGITKAVDIQLTDEDGNNYPQYSYPYSLDGRVIVADQSGNPADVYKTLGEQYRSGDTSRRFSLPINTTTDTNQQKTVTEEGLYIFRREYLDNTIDLGTDKRIIYRVYYIDRNGIINVSSNQSNASTLYNIGNNIKYTLGSGYSDLDAKYQKTIEASTIQNKQTEINKIISNSDHSATSLFTTNKIQVDYQMTYDKYYFANSISTHSTTAKNIVNSNSDLDDDKKTEIIGYLNNYLFNTSYFSNKYKLDLCISINEKEKGARLLDEQDNYKSDTGLSSYLKSKTDPASPLDASGNRANNFYFFMDIGSNNYYIQINDQAGYNKTNADGSLTKNVYANKLTMSFNIDHTAPEGNFYGKYYGRHDYDENKSNSDNPLKIPSIPIDGDNYNLLTYLKNGQLEQFANKNEQPSATGNYVQLISTNNETLIFTFAITNDDQKAQIDPKNIKVYKDGIADTNLIFNRVNSSFVATPKVTEARQASSFIKNVIDGIEYYAIIIFDNNLDEILDTSETDYSNFRLLDTKDNPDKATYYVQIQYVGGENDYIGQDAVTKNKVNYYKTTFEIKIDRIKPTYNLTKLMSLDKYVYNPAIKTTTTANYEQLFEQYKSYYNFELDEDYDYERSDLENYIFAMDTREDTSFVFENISELDNNESLYIRHIDKNNYKFSVTPDDYRAYYNALYLQGHPQFTPSSAIILNNDEKSISDFTSIKDKEGRYSTYFKIPFSLDGDDGDKQISAYDLKRLGILEEGEYYEIIEGDEAGNYRTYAIYIPKETNDQIVYSYQKDNNATSIQKGNINFGDVPYKQASGMNFNFTTIKTMDNFLKAKLNIVSDKINHNIEVILDPVKMTVTAINRTLDNTMYEVAISSIDYKDSNYTNTDEFMEVINQVLYDYYAWTNDKTNTVYYSEFGYNVYIDIVNRIGISLINSNKLYDYEIDYIVAGSTLTPSFQNYKNSPSTFAMIMDGEKGSTYLTKIVVEKFNKGWNQITSDNSGSPQLCSLENKTNGLKDIYEFNFTRGIYRFTFTDNFDRTNVFFWEFGISTSATGGQLSYAGATSNLDGYTYSSDKITYSYDSSVYNVYIKFTGKSTDETEDNGYKEYKDADNFIVYDSNANYSAEYLKKYGIQVFTTGNTTSITFSGATNQNLSQYHIKTIIASTTNTYSWNDEQNNNQIFVYNKKVAIYTAIPYVLIRNMSGNTLTTNPSDPDHLNLTEDFELIISWPSYIPTSERLAFNSKIFLQRTHVSNGIIRTTNSIVNSGFVVKEPGDYVAYVKNELGKESSPKITFTRGEGEISMYAVYAITKNATGQNLEKKLTPSPMIESVDDTGKVMFTYYITSNYCNYVDTNNYTFTAETIQEAPNLNLSPNTKANHIDLRVNSNLSIKAQIIEVGNDSYPYVKYQIFSEINGNEPANSSYVYRYINVVFVAEDNNNTKLADVEVLNSGSGDNLVDGTDTITSNASTMTLKMDFGTAEGLYVPNGDTLYLDRYYSGELAETITIDTTRHDLVYNEDTNPIYPIQLNIEEVGVHEFVLRDLAGRVHKFNGGDRLRIYLINEILYTVNGETPINNKVYNESVTIDIITSLDGMQLYNESSLEVIVTRNGTTSTVQNSRGQLELIDAGYYTVSLAAFTTLTETKVYSIYNFVIIDTEIAAPSFSISKGTGFKLEKLIKIVNGQEADITDIYSSTSTNLDTTLLWLSHSNDGNSIFNVTLSYYNEISDKTTSFEFKVWINDDEPQILSSIPAGTKTKDAIEIKYNPGQIYQQVGKGYITLSSDGSGEKKIQDITSISPTYAETLTIDKEGTYWFKIYTNDGVLVSAYKFTKNEPLNGITKLILIIAAILVVVVVILFFLLRRKGRYR